MLPKNNADFDKAILLDVVKPYNLGISLQAVRSFQPDSSSQSEQLQLATKINGTPTLVQVRQSPNAEGKVTVSSTPASDQSQLRKIAGWVLLAELDLSPFYSLAAKEPALAAITTKLYGLKPMRPISLFEMAVIAITEQQISLEAAYKIRLRVIQRFGQPIGDQWIFPEPQILARATFEDLRSCGLSHQKAQYIHDLATNIAEGKLDLDILKQQDDEKARKTIMSLRGFGRWSADYILIRGLARPDCVPADDLGIRSVTGEYLGNGHRATSSEVVQILEPYRPYRGLLAFYMLVWHRLKSGKNWNHG